VQSAATDGDVDNELAASKYLRRRYIEAIDDEN